MWDEVMERVRVLILADTALSAVIGQAYRKAGSGDLQIPGMEWNLLSDVLTELWAPMLVQFDIWTTTAANNRRAERRLRSLLHRPLPLQLDDVLMFTVFVDGNDLATPNRANFVGRGVRFRFTPLRQQYALPAH